MYSPRVRPRARAASASEPPAGPGACALAAQGRVPGAGPRFRGTRFGSAALFLLHLRLPEAEVRVRRGPTRRGERRRAVPSFPAERTPRGARRGSQRAEGFGGAQGRARPERPRGGAVCSGKDGTVGGDVCAEAQPGVGGPDGSGPLGDSVSPRHLLLAAPRGWGAAGGTEHRGTGK